MIFCQGNVREFELTQMCNPDTLLFIAFTGNFNDQKGGSLLPLTE